MYSYHISITSFKDKPPSSCETEMNLSLAVSPLAIIIRDSISVYIHCADDLVIGRTIGSSYCFGSKQRPKSRIKKNILKKTNNHLRYILVLSLRKNVCFPRYKLKYYNITLNGRLQSIYHVDFFSNSVGEKGKLTFSKIF